MIDKVLSDLRDIQSNIDTESKVWFTFAVDMSKHSQKKGKDL